ncbi:MAG: flagellar biosynthesis regulatory protein FlaF [Rhodobacteraceae bacterium]|nr:MAG: flagellar biosynthesis regulatory protein FlaF [Paracoccaceae bacterium]
MQSTTLAQAAYAPASPATHTPRDVEYHALAYVTGLMASARDMTDRPGGFAKLAEAMFENLKLWLTLAADAASEANQLARETRAQIIGLANFARTHMDRVLNGDDDVDALIDVNVAIMKGLRGEESGAA